MTRYCVVGVVAFCADFLALIVLTEIFGLLYVVSAALAFLLGLVVNYQLSIRWAFNFRRLSDRRMEFFIFSAVGVAGLGITEAVLWVGTDDLGMDYRLAKLLAVAIVLLWNFGLRKLLLFR